jgi:hypothetical protein
LATYLLNLRPFLRCDLVNWFTVFSADDVINNLMERDSLSILVFETVEHIELPPIAESVKGAQRG